MLDQDVLEKIVYFTDEEIDNLNGKNKIDKSIFMNETSNVIDYQKMLLNDQQITIRKHVRFCEYPKHRHNYIELMYVYGGQVTHVIEDKEITIQEGELLLLNQNIEHSIRYTNENDIIFNFIIKPELLDFLSIIMDKENEISNFIFDALYSYDNRGEYLVFKTQHISSVKEYIEKIILCMCKPRVNQNLEIKLLVGLLLTELMNYPEFIETYSYNSYEKLLGSKILKYIETSYFEGSLSTLSEEISLPDYKICKLVKKMTGKTFKRLIQDKRLNVASQLIRTSNRSISDIMLEVGYENMTYFYKIFKQQYSMTPHEYREVYKKNAK